MIQTDLYFDTTAQYAVFLDPDPIVQALSVMSSLDATSSGVAIGGTLMLILARPDGIFTELEVLRVDRLEKHRLVELPRAETVHAGVITTRIETQPYPTWASDPDRRRGCIQFVSRPTLTRTVRLGASDVYIALSRTGMLEAMFLEKIIDDSKSAQMGAWIRSVNGM